MAGCGDGVEILNTFVMVISPPGKARADYLELVFFLPRQRHGPILYHQLLSMSVRVEFLLVFLK